MNAPGRQRTKKRRRVVPICPTLEPWLKLFRRGVPESQIDTAAGHRGAGTNNRHLRPEYLTQFIDGVDSLWADVGKLTTVHRRYQRDTTIFDLGDVVSKARGDQAESMT